MSTEKSKKSNYTHPDTIPVGKEELINIIKEAESGVFYSTEAVKNALNK